MYQMVCCRHTRTCNPGPPIITETGSGDNELHSTPQDFPLSTAASKQWAYILTTEASTHSEHSRPSMRVSRLLWRNWTLHRKVPYHTQTWHEANHTPPPMEVPNSNETTCANWAGMLGMPWSHLQGRWTHRLGLFSRLCLETKWQSLSMLGSQRAKQLH